jgi:hypothetical protein
MKVLWLPTDLWWKRYWWSVVIGILAVALICSLLIPVPKVGKEVVEVTKEVEVIREVEVPVEVIKEVIKEVEVPIAPPDPPQIVGQTSHRDQIMLLREKFPKALFRGANRPEYDLTTISEIRRFLREDKTDEMGLDVPDSVFRLIGQFSVEGWDGIPIGFVRTDAELYNVVSVKEGLYRINPQTDSLQKISSPVEAKGLFVILK